MPSQKRKFGDIGEKIAEKYLIDKGYRIIEKNYLKPYGEIDIVGANGKIITFFEVKTSDISQTRDFLPEQRVNHKKARKLRKTCEVYLLERKYPIDQEWQIDILSVVLDKDIGNPEVNHFENAVWEERY